MENSKKSSYQTVILNLIQDLQRLPLQFINSLRGRYPAGRPFKYGMTALLTRVRAFTLMELLVVVLIIGVLAAVAVPQYKKAVLKSRFSTVFPMVKAITQGNENYYLANGEYATQLPSLDIDKPEGDTSGVLVGLKSTEYFDYVLGTRQGMNNNYIMYQKHSPNFADNIHCEAKTDDTQANDLCKSLGGVQTTGGQTDGYTTYILQGNAADGHLPTVYNGNNDIAIELTALEKCVTSGGYTCLRNRYNGSVCEAKHNNACWSGTYTNESTCDAGKNTAGSCQLGSYDNSTCDGSQAISGACSGPSFTNQSTCIGGGVQWGCSKTSFTDSECQGIGAKSCGANSKGEKATFNNSTCRGEGSNSCSSSTYTNNSQCIMKNNTACQNNTYQTGAGCQAASGFTCPAGTPQPGGWDADTETYTPIGWNGGYCDPSAMVGGKCPAGSPRSTSGTCWDGDGNEVSCS